MPVRGLILLALAWAALSAGPGEAASLNDELRDLVINHPRIRSTQELVGAGKEGERRAFAPYLPSVTMQGNAGWQYTDSPISRITNGEPLRHSRKQDQLNVTETLFDGFRREANSNAAKAAREGAEVQVDSVRQQVMLEGIGAYLDVLKQQRLVALSRRNEGNIQTQLQLEDERVNRGSGIAVDVLLAKSRLQLSKERRVAFEGSLRDAVTRYGQVFDHAPDFAAMSEPAFPPGVLPDSIEQTRQVALAEHPDIVASRKNIDQAEEKRNAAQGGFYPRLDVVGRALYEADVEGLRGSRRDGLILLQATWELFSGFGTQAEVGQANYQLSSTVANHTFVNRSVVQEAELAWQGLDTATQREGLLRNAVNIAAEVFESRKKLRSAGKDTALNVLDAENEVFNAEINLLGATYDARLARYRLLKAVGRLDLGVLGAR